MQNATAWANLGALYLTHDNIKVHTHTHTHTEHASIIDELF
jgi:hypothetical protein